MPQQPESVAPRVGVDVRRADHSATDIESVWIEPMCFRPRPMFADQPLPRWLRQPIPLQPYERAVWIAGHWIWQRRWIWAYGVWAPRPGPTWRWRPAHYRRWTSGVWFTPGHWRPAMTGTGTGTGTDGEDGCVYDGAGALDDDLRRAGPGSDWAPLPRSALSLRYGLPCAA